MSRAGAANFPLSAQTCRREADGRPSLAATSVAATPLLPPLLPDSSDEAPPALAGGTGSALPARKRLRRVDGSPLSAAATPLGEPLPSPPPAPLFAPPPAAATAAGDLPLRWRKRPQRSKALPVQTTSLAFAAAAAAAVTTESAMPAVAAESPVVELVAAAPAAAVAAAAAAAATPAPAPAAQLPAAAPPPVAAPPPSPSPPPMQLLDLPQPLLDTVFEQHFLLARSHCGERERANIGVDWDGRGPPLSGLSSGALVTRASWVAVAPAGHVCRRFRASFLSAIRDLYVCFDQAPSRAGLGTGSEGQGSRAAAVSAMTRTFVERSSNLVGVLPKLGRLCAFGMRYKPPPSQCQPSPSQYQLSTSPPGERRPRGSLVPPWVPLLLHREVLSSAARLPALRVLSWDSHAVTPALLSLISGMPLDRLRMSGGLSVTPGAAGAAAARAAVVRLLQRLSSTLQVLVLGHYLSASMHLVDDRPLAEFFSDVGPLPRLGLFLWPPSHSSPMWRQCYGRKSRGHCCAFPTLSRTWVYPAA